MKPVRHRLLSHCPLVPKERVREHLRRLDEEYFERFDLQSPSLPRQATELEALARRVGDVDASADGFLADLENPTQRVHAAYVAELFAVESR